MKTLKIVVYILKNEFRNKQAVIFIADAADCSFDTDGNYR